MNISEYIAKNLISGNQLKFSSIYKILKGANALNKDFLTFVLNKVKIVFAPQYPLNFIISDWIEKDLPEVRYSCAGEVLKDVLGEIKIVDLEVSSGFGRTTIQDCIGNRGKNNALTNLIIFWECYKIVPGISTELVLEFMYLLCSEIIGKDIKVEILKLDSYNTEHKY